MAPECANIFYAEDYEVAAEYDKEFLEGSGHHIVSQASSVQEAKQQIATLKKGDIQVAIVDGNLGTSSDNSDGETIAKLLHKKDPNIIIGHSKDNPITGANINVSKKVGLAPLAEAVTKA